MKPTYRITGADERGVPLGIECDQCGWTYTRSEDDPAAELLAVHAHSHTRNFHNNYPKGHK
jgi:hypothetical protein